jgi:predicted DNA-binding transcriptional regulator AlpA
VTSAAGLRVLRRSPASTKPPPHRGRLLTARQVATELFCTTVSPAWVRRHVTPKVVLGHSTVRFYEHDVIDWIACRRSCPPAMVST